MKPRLDLLKTSSCQWIVVCFLIWWIKTSLSDKWRGIIHPDINFLSIFASNRNLSISAAVSLLPAFHKDTTHPISNNPLLWQSFCTRRAGERRWPRALQFYLLLSGSSSLVFLLCKINMWIDFDLFCNRHALISFIWDHDHDEVDQGHMKSRRERDLETQRIKSEWLTRSQSTFRKNGWPMMSAKPVWGWQPRRSLGSCGRSVWE